MVRRPEIQAFKAATLAAGKPLVYNGGPASLLCTFPNPNQTYVQIDPILSSLRYPTSYAAKSFTYMWRPPEISAFSS